MTESSLNTRQNAQEMQEMAKTLNGLVKKVQVLEMPIPTP